MCFFTMLVLLSSVCFSSELLNPERVGLKSCSFSHGSVCMSNTQRELNCYVDEDDPHSLYIGDPLLRIETTLFDGASESMRVEKRQNTVFITEFDGTEKSVRIPDLSENFHDPKSKWRQWSTASSHVITRSVRQYKDDSGVVRKEFVVQVTLDYTIKQVKIAHGIRGPLNLDDMEVETFALNPYEVRWLKEGFPVRVMYMHKNDRYSTSFDVRGVLYNVDYLVPGKGLKLFENVSLVQPMDLCLMSQAMLGFERPPTTQSTLQKTSTWLLSEMDMDGYEPCYFYSHVLREFLTKICPKLLQSKQQHRVAADYCWPSLPVKVLEGLDGYFSTIKWLPVQESVLETAQNGHNSTPVIFVIFENGGILRGVPEWNILQDESLVWDGTLLRDKMIVEHVEDHFVWSEALYKQCVNYKRSVCSVWWTHIFGPKKKEKGD